MRGIIIHWFMGDLNIPGFFMTVAIISKRTKFFVNYFPIIYETLELYKVLAAPGVANLKLRLKN